MIVNDPNAIEAKSMEIISRELTVEIPPENEAEVLAIEGAFVLGTVISEQRIVWKEESISLKEAVDCWEKPLSRVFHHYGETPEGKAEIKFWKGCLLELLEKAETLDFSPDELEIEARTDNLDDVQTFVGEILERADCPMKTQMQIDVAVEEIYVNIASYAYAPLTGIARIKVEVSGDPATVTITFIDKGTPYDPSKKKDPDVHAPAEERNIGGLGIYMTKKLMDEVTYEHKDGQNILILKKQL